MLGQDSAGADSVPSSDGVALGIMRKAAAQFIEANGLREFARQMEMSPSGADKLVKGETQPREPTMRKFRQWLLSALDAGYVTVSREGSGLIAFQLLVQDKPKAKQKAAAYSVYDVLRNAFAATGLRAPRWFQRLRKLIDEEFE